MKKKAKSNMEKKLQIKKEIEHISNKTLTVFSVALVCEVLLLYIYSALKASSRYLKGILPWTALITFLIFIGLFIAAAVVAKKKGESAVTKRLKNWGFFSLAFSFSAFYIKAGDAISAIMGLFNKSDAASVITVRLVNITGKTGALYLMGAVAVYTIVSLIYFDLKIRKMKKTK